VTRDELPRAIAEGECVADLDIDAALHLLYGPLYSRLLMFGRAPTERQTRAFVELAAKALSKPRS